MKLKEEKRGETDRCICFEDKIQVCKGLLRLYSVQSVATKVQIF